jgi:hypothetical protein
VFDVHADVEGRDLNSAAADIDEVIAAARRTAPRGVSITLSGQIETMRESYAGLFSGMALAVVLVFLLLVINFQSWMRPTACRDPGGSRRRSGPPGRLASRCSAHGRRNCPRAATRNMPILTRYFTAVLYFASSVAPPPTCPEKPIGENAYAPPIGS